MDRRKSKTKIIIFLFVTMIFMGVGYSALQSNLNISGTAKSSGTFNVEIVGVTPEESSTFTPTTATLNAKFNKPGDSVNYYVQVKNKGTIDALIEGHINKSDNVKDSNNNDMYLFNVEYENEKNVKFWKYYELNAGVTTTLKVTIAYNEDAESFPDRDVTFTLILEATQLSSPQSQEKIDGYEGEWDYKLDESGKIIGYNPSFDGIYDDNGYLVIGETNVNGESITSIDKNSLLLNNNNVFIFSNNDEMSVYIDYAKGSNEYNKIKETLLQLGIEEDIEASGTSLFINDFKFNRLVKIVNPKIKRMDTQKCKMYGKGEIKKPTEGSTSVYINPETGELDLSSSTSSVTKLDLSNAKNLVEISDETFEYSNLESIKFSTTGSLKKIGAHAFYGSKLSGTLRLPSSVTDIGDYAFSNNQIDVVSCENNCNLQAIGKNAFYNNQINETLIIPKSVVNIGEYAFSGNQIDEIIFEDNSALQSINKNAFSGNQINKTLIIPKNVTNIGENAFAGNNQMGTIAFEDNSKLTTIGESAFSNVTFENMVIPKNVTTIENRAFYRSKITGTLTIPKNVTSIIGDSVFEYPYQGDYLINSLYIDMETIPSDVFAQKGISNLILGDNVKNISSSAFSGNKITSLIIPSTVTQIGSYAFSYNSQLKNIDIKNGLEYISSSAFIDCALESITIPSSVTSIGEWAFSSNQINTINFASNSSLRTIGKLAFANNPFTGKIIIPSGVESIDEWAFGMRANKSSTIDEIVIPNSITSIGDSAFGRLYSGYNIIKITIDMTQSEWNRRGLSPSNWYSGSPIIKYNEE